MSNLSVKGMCMGMMPGRRAYTGMRAFAYCFCSK
jgi:hypothetical protein